MSFDGFEKTGIDSSTAALTAASELLGTVGQMEAMRSAFAGIDLSGFGAPTEANDIAASTVSGVAPEKGAGISA